MNRRQFLSAGAASAASLAISKWGVHSALGADDKPLRVGLIGCGWYGKVDLFRLLQVAPVEVVSLCDVDQHMLTECADRVAARQASKNKPRTYGDYREMLKEKDLDIVLIGTPDHWHALQTIAAVEAGADVYVQKPISVDVVEGQAMLAAARKQNRVVQVGTQRRSTPHLIEARQIVQDGRLGNIGHVDICCYYTMRSPDNPPDSTPPDYLDYEMWIGPAPKRPYDALIHPRRWRSYMEYGNGLLGDMCIHMYDMTRWMMNLGWPTRISSTGGILVDKAAKANITDTQTATFDHGDLQVVWQHRTWGQAPDPKYRWAAILYGDQGTLKASVQGFEFLPATGEPISKTVKLELTEFPEDAIEPDLDKPSAPAIRAHMKDFLSARESRGKPVADIEEGHISTASCILANIAMKLGRELTWDSKAGKVVGDEEANKLLARTYRSPWVHPCDC